MKHRLKEAKRIIGVYNEDMKELEDAMIKDVKQMSFYRTNKQPELKLGGLPGMALWKISVEFTTGVIQDITYKTEPV